MAKFEICSSGNLIGRSDLELGDALMGVAEGRFLPLPSFEQIRASSQSDPLARTTISQKHLNLTEQSPCLGGVQIFDYSAELGPQGLMVEVFGIPYPLCQELFPDQVAAYRNLWRK